MIVEVIALVLLAVSLAGGCLVGARLCRYAGTDYHPCDSERHGRNWGPM